MDAGTIRRAAIYDGTLNYFDYRIRKAGSKAEEDRLKEEKDKFLEASKKEEERLKRENAGAGKPGYNDKGNTQHPSPKIKKII